MEFEDGSIMGGTTVEHIKEGAAVLGEYCDIIGVRSFAELQNREKDYSEEIFHKIEHYSQRPTISLESATRHPLQSLTDKIETPKAALSTLSKIRPSEGMALTARISTQIKNEIINH
jgi:N-succinyl-L-ornithine transcarbamylase